MKKINKKFLICILLAFLVSLSVAYAEDLNTTDDLNLADNPDDEISINSDENDSLKNVDESLNEIAVESDDDNLSHTSEEVLSDDYIFPYEDGADNVRLSNGYYAFCIDPKIDPPKAESMYNILHEPKYNIGEEVWDKLKIAIVTYVDVSHYTEPYDLAYHGDTFHNSRLQYLIWMIVGWIEPFEGDRELNNMYQEVISRYNGGVRYDDHYEDQSATTTFVYDFIALRNTGLQDLIGYKYESTPKHSDFELYKVTLNKVVNLSDQVTFEIILKNTGEAYLDDLFIIEDKWDDGLVYDSYKNGKYEWSHRVNSDGKHQWTLSRLDVGDQISLFVTFNTTKAGNFTNYAIGGWGPDRKTVNNNTTVIDNTTIENTTKNETKNNTTLNITDETADTDDSIDIAPDEASGAATSTQKSVPAKKISANATGNPIFCLLMVLVSLVAVRRKK